MKFVPTFLFIILNLINDSFAKDVPLVNKSNQTIGIQKPRPLYIIKSGAVTMISQDVIVSPASVENVYVLTIEELKNMYSQYANLDANLFAEFTLKPGVKLLTIEELLKLYNIHNSKNLTFTINGEPAVDGKLILVEKSVLESVILNQQLQVVDITTIYKKKEEEYRKSKLAGDKEISEMFKNLKRDKPKQSKGNGTGRIPGFHKNP
ncbi:MAG TPA: hypothetical protein VF623_09500 [Segetibacter sp.]|jgi:hypothetical protein